MRTFVERIWALVVIASLPTGLMGSASSTMLASSPSQGNLERFVIVSAESQVVYRVGETIINDNNRLNVAVGITNAIQGEIFIDRTSPPNSRVGTITIDISQFKSDSQRRDLAIRRQWLESARHPIAEFAPTAVHGLPQIYAEGREVILQIIGNLKVRERVRPTTFATTLRLQGDILTGVATTTVQMTDFGFDPPSIFGILRAENGVKLEFRFTARRG